MSEIKFNPEHLSGSAKEAEQCFRCGACRVVCPTFQVSGEEAYCARGRLSLVRSLLDERFVMDQWVAGQLDSCLRCGACTEVCPRRVPTDRILLAAKEDLVAGGRLILPQVGRIMRYVLPRPRLYRGALKALYLLQKLYPPSQTGGGLRHLPHLLLGGIESRDIPLLARLPAGRRSWPENEALKNPKAVVHLFTGCLLEYVYPQIIDAIMTVFTRLGVRVIIPENQICCGMPALGLGDRVTAERIRDHNMAIFEKSGAKIVLTACATCGFAWKEALNSLDGAGIRLYDISEFIESFHRKDFSGFSFSEPLTYHDPCHLAKKQGIRAEPRELLRRIAPFYVEASNAGDCCGAAGLFSLTHKELSGRIQNRKIEGLMASGARVVATGCPGCINFLQNGFTRKGADIKVMHTLEVLALSCTKNVK